MSRYTKSITRSEAKNKIVNIELKAYSVESITNSGAQASINIPKKLRDFLLENNIVEEDDNLSNELSTDKQKYQAYNLSTDYTFILEYDLKRILNLNKDLNFGFFMITGENIKFQIRPSQYNQLQETSDINYSWLEKLLKQAYIDSELIFIFDTLNKTMTLSYNSKAIDKINIQEKASTYNTDIIENIVPPLQTLYFGAPGTGKSYNLGNVIKSHSWIDIPIDTNVDDLPNVFRSTLYAEFTYHDFIGTIMPVVKEDDITYEFKPGIFTESLKYAFQYPNTPVYLILEEMSRANIANVFGDIFQLLDRKPLGTSTFKINNDLIAKEIAKVNDNFYDAKSNTFKKIYFPPNFSILGTVNSNDQNVFVMDTAFKRRFDFSYISTDPISNESNVHLNDFSFRLHGEIISWISFYTKLNKFILEEAKLTEDKQIGQFFIIGEYEGNNFLENNTNAVKNKLLNYLWFDVNPAIFTGEKLFNTRYLSFHDVFKDFDNKDKKILNLDLYE